VIASGPLLNASCRSFSEGLNSSALTDEDVSPEKGRIKNEPRIDLRFMIRPYTDLVGFRRDPPACRYLKGKQFPTPLYQANHRMLAILHSCDVVLQPIYVLSIHSKHHIPYLDARMHSRTMGQQMKNIQPFGWGFGAIFEARTLQVNIQRHQTEAVLRAVVLFDVTTFTHQVLKMVWRGFN